MNAKAMYRISITAVGIMLVAACHDDPVALHGSERSSSFDELPIASSSSGSSSAVAPVDNTRPRFRVDFSVTGAVMPGARITVTLEGEAVEKVAADGTVTVRLPTMASMAYAGAGNRPTYPLDQALPVVSKWTLSAMEPGDTWQRSFTVRLPSEEGYYHLAVDVDTEAPVGVLGSPYVSDRVHFERWLIVTDTDGRITRRFEESVFADGIAPVPGPFRNKISRRSASHAADGVGMDSDAYVYMRVKYLHGRSGYRAADGGYAHVAEWHDSDHTDGPYNRQSATVGASGIVRFTCPSNGYHLEGGVDLPSTSLIDGAGFSGYWEAGHNDCGDTIDAEGPRSKYLPWKNLREVTTRIRSHFGFSSVPRVAWVTNENARTSSYNPATHRITFAGDTYDNKWTAAHEYGHAVHEKRLGGLWTVESSCYVFHAIWGASGYKCALQEGFADYSANIGVNYTPPTANFESPPGDAPSPRTEGYVAALLWDLIDSENEGDDETTYSAASVSTAFRSCRVRVSGTWRKRNNVSDFVWCMENRINGDLHEDEFPGLTTPTAQSAVRGSGWDAADVRSTWLQNLSG